MFIPNYMDKSIISTSVFATFYVKESLKRNKENSISLEAMPVTSYLALGNWHWHSESSSFLFPMNVLLVIISKGTFKAAV